MKTLHTLLFGVFVTVEKYAVANTLDPMTHFASSLTDVSDAVQMKSTPEAFLELAALSLIGNQFYLY